MNFFNKERHLILKSSTLIRGKRFIKWLKKNKLFNTTKRIFTMKKILIIALCFLAFTKVNAQECAKFIEPKFSTTTIEENGNTYNPNDYEFKMVLAGKAPVTKAHYKTITIKDGYTAIDYEKSKATGYLCTKWVAPVTKEILDYTEVVSPPIMPVFAYVKKQNCSKPAIYTIQKTVKDGYITTANCN